jgi:flagellar basal body-associated protein FliL
MKLVTIVIISFLVLLAIAIGLFVFYMIRSKKNNDWKVNPWMISFSTTAVNVLSYSITGKVHCITDAILATSNNNYNGNSYAHNAQYNSS